MKVVVFNSNKDLRRKGMYVTSAIMGSASSFLLLHLASVPLIDLAFANAILALLAGKQESLIVKEAIAPSDTNFQACDSAYVVVAAGDSSVRHLQKAPPCSRGRWRRHQQLPGKQDEHEDSGGPEGGAGSHW